MKELKEIFFQIQDSYFSNLDNDSKYKKVSLLWNEYYRICREKGIYLEEVDNLRLMLENECYSIYQEPKLDKVNDSKVGDAIEHLEEVIFYNNNNGLVNGISIEEAKLILDYVIYEVRKIYGKLGVDVLSNSLNGYCELGQSLSIRCLENLGVRVTKNSVKDFYNYDLNHCFGTAMFPIMESDGVENKVFLIDTTYRQFFTSIRCNEGMYDKEDELYSRPDPGYFVKDVSVAKKIMRDGYIELDQMVAKSYGESFYLSSLDKGNVSVNSSINYYDNIINSTDDYKLEIEELEGLEVKFPSNGYKKGGFLC